MSFKVVAGVIKDAGNVAESKNCYIKLDPIKSIGDTYKGAEHIDSTDDDGNYSINVPVGTYDVFLSYDYGSTYERTGRIQVLTDTPSPVTLSTLLANQQVPSDDNVLAAQSAAADATTQATASAASAASVAASSAAIATNTSEIAAISNPNLLINGDFSVWQRGESFSSTSYTADRWVAYTISSVSKDQTLGYPVMRLQSTTGIPYMRQPIEDISSVAGKTVTASYWAKFSSGANRAGSYPDDTDGGVVSTVFVATGETDADGFARYSATFQYTKAYSSNPSLRIDFTENTDVLIKDAKLELGNRATPFIPDDPATNLAKCQRYYISETCNYPFTSAPSSTTQRLSISLPVELRTTPTVSVTSTNGYQSLTAFPTMIYITSSYGDGANFITDFTADAEL